MTGTVHITNGDAAADLLRRSPVAGPVLPWRDVLHEGPVPSGLSLEDLSRVRAAYLESSGLARPGDAATMFAERDRALRAAGAGNVILWFEHDLYDQLQLWQLLDWFSAHPPAGTIELIEVGEFPGVEKFIGLGQLSPSQLGSLIDFRRPVTAAQFTLGSRAWSAFRAADPRALESLLRESTFALPFLQDAVLRLLEEYPSDVDGLPRTERSLLEAAAEDRTLLHLFRAVQAREERPFMGDSVVRERLRALAGGTSPLLTGRGRRLSFDHVGSSFWSQEAVLTPAGRKALEHGGDWFETSAQKRFIGGTEIGPGRARWRWSNRARKMRAPEEFR